MKKSNLGTSKGFTLIEIIMISVIVCIIAAVAIPRFISFREEAKAARDHSVLGALRSAVYIYYVQHCVEGECSYPADTIELINLVNWHPPDLYLNFEWNLTGNLTP